jgi:dienelactone hydrolase
MNHSNRRQVLDCGSPLPLCAASPAMEKRQRAAAVQDAIASDHASRHKHAKPFLNLSLPLLLALLLAPHCFAAETSADAQLKHYFRTETATLAERCLADIRTLDDWTSQRATFRRQYQEMLGLWPMPERTDLKPVITGKLEQEEFTVEKLHFQALPGLYCTANLFLPKNSPQPAPTILYECGHWRLVTNGISYGNKAAAVYQGDGAWFARNGYVCLVLDTVLAGEIQGIHTGTRDKGLWWWNSRGYTPAGVEAWFGMRALDYLSTRPEVDTNRFGITGHSGGGAYSWAVTALDDRIKVAAPLAGMADLQSHIGDGVIDSHCDCNFPINYYRWDFPQIAALAAPRPLLIGGTDRDGLFNLENTLRIHDKVRRLYQLHKANDKLGLILAPGGHDETPELQLAVLRWFNRHLKGEEKPVEMAVKKFFTPEQLRVFTELPTDAINTNIAETFVPPATIFSLSSSKGGEGWGEEAKAKNPSPQPSPRSGGARETNSAPHEQRSAAELATLLREKVFAGWPADDLPLDPKQTIAIERDGLRLRAWDLTSQHDVGLRLYLLEDATKQEADAVQLRVLDDSSDILWLHDLRAGFGAPIADEPADTSQIANIVSPLVSLKAKLKSSGVSLAWFAPRGVGRTVWSGDAKAQTKIRRRFMALGQTLDGMRVWDIRRAVQMIHFVRDGDVAKVEITASGPMGVNSLYASLFEPSVRRIELSQLPQSHTEGPDYLGVLRFTDIPQVLEAVGAKAVVRD